MVGRDLAEHDDFAESPGALDRDHRAIAGRRAACEHHAGAASIDHCLHNHGHRNARLRKLLPEPVVERLDRIETGPTAPELLEHLVAAAHPEIRVLESREAGIGRVLGGCGRAHGDRLRAACGQRLPGVPDLRDDFGRQLHLFDARAQLARARRDRVEIVGIQRGDPRAQRRLALDRLEVPLESRGSHDKTRRHRESGVLELAEARTLAADGRTIGEPDLPEPADIGERAHDRLRAMSEFERSRSPARNRRSRPYRNNFSLIGRPCSRHQVS